MHCRRKLLCTYVSGNLELSVQLLPTPMPGDRPCLAAHLQCSKLSYIPAISCSDIITV